MSPVDVIIATIIPDMNMILNLRLSKRNGNHHLPNGAMQLSHRMAFEYLQFAH